MRNKWKIEKFKHNHKTGPPYLTMIVRRHDVYHPCTAKISVRNETKIKKYIVRKKWNF